MCASARSLLITMALLSSFAAGARGQLPAPVDGGLRAISGFDRLIMIEDVQKALKLSDEQAQAAKEVVHQIRQQHREEFDKAVKSSEESGERHEKVTGILQKISAETLARLKGLFSPEQLTRLKQIELQERGLRAFSDPHVKTALQLTQEQRTKIQEIAERAEVAMRQSLQAGAKTPDSSRALKGFLAARRQMMDEAVRVLTGDQRKTWSALAGPPFEFKIERRTIPSGQLESKNPQQIP
jgi:hypothetical protein